MSAQSSVFGAKGGGEENSKSPITVDVNPPAPELVTLGARRFQTGSSTFASTNSLLLEHSSRNSDNGVPEDPSGI